MPTGLFASKTALVQEVREIVLSARALAARSVDTVQVAMSFTIGQRIVEHEQGGDKRAAYGKQVMEHLALLMTAEFGRGFSKRNMELMRRFYLMYSPRMANLPAGLVSFPQITQIVSAQSVQEKIGQIAQTTSAQLPGLPLIWHHLTFFHDLPVCLLIFGIRPARYAVNFCSSAHVAATLDKRQSFFGGRIRKKRSTH